MVIVPVVFWSTLCCNFICSQWRENPTFGVAQMGSESAQHQITKHTKKITSKTGTYTGPGKTKQNKLCFLAGVAAALNNYNLCKSQQLWAFQKRSPTKGEHQEVGSE